MKDLFAAVREDIRCHRENGVDLNPYSTKGARWSWQNGFEGKPEVLLGYDIPYKRGKLAAQLTRGGRELTDPASVEAGIGPICAGKF